MLAVQSPWFLLLIEFLLPILRNTKLGMIIHIQCIGLFDNHRGATNPIHKNYLIMPHPLLIIIDICPCRNRSHLFHYHHSSEFQHYPLVPRIRPQSSSLIYHTILTRVVHGSIQSPTRNSSILPPTEFMTREPLQCRLPW